MANPSVNLTKTHRPPIPQPSREVLSEKTVSFDQIARCANNRLSFIQSQRTVSARITINRKNGSLSIASVISSDHGIYECHTLLHDDDAPISSRKTNLTVIETLKFAPQPTSKNLEMGTVSKVHCKVQGSPTPQVKWTKVRQFSFHLTLQTGSASGYSFRITQRVCPATLLTSMERWSSKMWPSKTREITRARPQVPKEPSKRR